MGVGCSNLCVFVRHNLFHYRVFLCFLRWVLIRTLRKISFCGSGGRKVRIFQLIFKVCVFFFLVFVLSFDFISFRC